MIESSLRRKGHIDFTAVSPGKPGIDAEAMQEQERATDCSTGMPMARSYEGILSWGFLLLDDSSLCQGGKTKTKKLQTPS